MRNLDRALTDIAEMRSQLARSTEFRGYGPLTLAATGVLALAAAAAQAVFLSNPSSHPHSYVVLWTLTAIMAAVLIGIEAVTRSRRIHSGLATEMIMQAIEQFLPAAVIGLLLTLVLLQSAPDSLWMLPGLWQTILSLGVFASCRSLPRPLVAVGVWYMTCGMASLAFAQGTFAFSPLAMGLPFAGGQWLAAALVQFSGANDAEG